MKVKSIKFLSDFKQFKEGQIFHFFDEQNTNVEYGLTTFSVIAGRNGSGKTTLMSLIPNLFHHIERYTGRIQANFELHYIIRHLDSEIDVRITHNRNLTRVSIPGIFDNVQVVPRRNARTNDFSNINRDEEYIEYSLFHPYAPVSVVSSTFSLHGEYPVSRPNNYQGYQIVSDLSVTNIYGKNHYDLGSISIGILRFIKFFFEHNSDIKELLSLFELRFTNRVLIKYLSYDPEWVTVSNEWLDEHSDEVQNEDAYLNDIEFERHGKLIYLNNMSSGGKMLLLRSISILHSIEHNSIVIIEEPELHLDQVWNKQLISLFMILYKRFRSHIIISTHDYSIINSVPKNNILLLENGAKKVLNESTFLASYDELFRILYGEKFKTNKIEEEFLRSLSEKTVDELTHDYVTIGNSVYKYLVFREIKKRG